MWANVILVIVAAIILVAIYIVVQPKKSREQFALDVEQDYRSAIVRAFNTTLGRDPQEYEVQLYRGSMKSPYDTTSVEGKLMASAEYGARKGAIPLATTFADIPSANGDMSALVKDNVNAPVVSLDVDASNAASITATNAPPTGSKLTSLDLGQRLAVYRSILTVYENNLDRLPTMKELNYYAAKLVDDGSFTISKLMQILQASQEYDILQKNQSNIVNGELPGAITDAQLTLRVNEIYADMFNGEQPTKTFEEFAKAKFVEYQLDEVKFRKMLSMLNDLDVANATATGTGSTVNVNANASVANVNANANVANSTINPSATIQTFVQQEHLAVGSSGTSVVFDPSIGPAATKTPISTIMPPQQPTLACAIANNDPDSWQPYMRGNLCSASEAYSKDKFFDSLYTNIQMADAGKCVGISSTNSTTAQGRNRVAEAFVDREKASLGYECSRSELLQDTDTRYSYDPNIVPQLRNTRFGTFLDDANNTKVGSIMPKFIYKEYGTVN